MRVRLRVLSYLVVSLLRVRQPLQLRLVRYAFATLLSLPAIVVMLWLADSGISLAPALMAMTVMVFLIVFGAAALTAGLVMLGHKGLVASTAIGRALQSVPPASSSNPPSTRSAWTDADDT